MGQNPPPALFGKITERRLMSIRRLILLLVFSAVFLGFGCAHVPDSPHPAAGYMAQNQEGQPKSDAEDPYDLLSDELADELDEEMDAPQVRVADPLEPWNKLMFHVNDKLYFWVLKPVSKAWRAVVPEPARVSVSNFFGNLSAPVRITAAFLQGKPEAAGTETARFMINTTVGILGLFDPAKKYENLAPVEEDLGQTLAVYGMGEGIYIIWPFFGPSTLRDSIGLGGEFFLNPLFYVNPAEISYAAKGVDVVNDTSFRIGDYESFKKMAVDPYAAMKNGYIQMRNAAIKK